MEKNVKKHDFIVGFSYLSFLTVCLTASIGLAACGKGDTTPKTDVISCDRAVGVFKLGSTDEPLKLSDLKPGLYDYEGGDFYFESNTTGSSFKIQTEEAVRKNSASGEIEVAHQFRCREGYSKKADDTVAPFGGVAPRLLMIDESGQKIDVVDRSFAFALNKGFPMYSFRETEESQSKKTVTALEKNLIQTWDKHYFLHTGIRRYSFVASKKVENGTIRVRIDYVKSKGNILEDGDIFMPIPDVQF